MIVEAPDMTITPPTVALNTLPVGGVFWDLQYSRAGGVQSTTLNSDGNIPVVWLDTFQDYGNLEPTRQVIYTPNATLNWNL